MPGNINQHHCARCGSIAKPRCARQGHMEQCKIHNVYHNSRSECVRCKEQEKREEREKRRAREKEGKKANRKADPNNKENTE
ncbi:hypothetical protein VTK73DRAFT_8102 [Phialemonium thermophilum]|uniref:Uncharacterized protein n=1 Tax=Phialemonium thermophilum TaxID=223376 RepID=A0ABR3WAK5_9PEZI